MSSERADKLLAREPIGRLVPRLLRVADAHSPIQGNILRALSQKLLPLFANLRGAYVIGDFGTYNTFMEDNGLETVASMLAEYAAAIHVPFPLLSTQQRQIIGLAALLDNKYQVLQDEGISIDIRSIASRYSHTRYTGNPEDPLSILENLVWYRGDQREAATKSTIQTNSVRELLGAERPLTVGDFYAIFRKLSNAVYGKEHVLEFIRTSPNAIDSEVWEMTDPTNMFTPDEYRFLRALLPSPDGSRRGAALDAILDDFNRFDIEAEEERTGYPPEGVLSKEVAKLYATYIAIHPHPDFNNTMSGILINLLCERNGVRAIDWYAVKKERQQRSAISSGFAKWITQDTEMLERIFFRMILSRSRAVQAPSLPAREVSTPAVSREIRVLEKTELTRYTINRYRLAENAQGSEISAGEYVVEDDTFVIRFFLDKPHTTFDLIYNCYIEVPYAICQLKKTADDIRSDQQRFLENLDEVDPMELATQLELFNGSSNSVVGRIREQPDLVYKTVNGAIRSGFPDGIDMVMATSRINDRLPPHIRLVPVVEGSHLGYIMPFIEGTTPADRSRVPENLDAVISVVLSSLQSERKLPLQLELSLNQHGSEVRVSEGRVLFRLDPFDHRVN